jgi:hypothetical protein
MRRVDCRRCGVVAVEEAPWGRRQSHIDRSLYALLQPVGRVDCHGKRQQRPSHILDAFALARTRSRRASCVASGTHTDVKLQTCEES